MLEKLTSWLWGDAKRPAAPAARLARPRGSVPQPVPRRSPSQDAFNAKLRALCRNQQVVSGGRLHILNLGTIKERFGKKWTLISDKIGFVIKRTLQQKLGAGDFHHEVDENVFVVIFAGLSGEQAALKCRVIAQEIMTRLFGDASDVAAVQIQSAAVELDGSVLIETIDPLGLVFESLERAAPRVEAHKAVASPVAAAAKNAGAAPPTQARSGRAPPVSAPVAAPAAAARPPLQQQPEQDRASSEAGPQWQAMSASARAPSTPGNEAPAAAMKRVPEWVEIERPEARNGAAAQGIEYQHQVYDLMRLIGDTEKEVGGWQRYQTTTARVHYDKTRDQYHQASGGEGAGGPARPSGADPARELLSFHEITPQKAEAPHRRLIVPGQLKDTVFSYHPIWFAAKNAIMSYQCELRFRGDAGLSSIDEILADTDDPALETMVDLLLLRKAMVELACSAAENRKAVITVPMHGATLANPQTRSRILELCAEAPEPLKRLLTVELTNLYAIDWKRLPDLVARTKKLTRGVVLRVSLDQPLRAELVSAGAAAVGVDLRDHGWPEERALRALNQFAKEAQSVGLETYVCGVETRSLVIAAVCAGFDFVSGEAVVPAVESPTGVYPFDPFDLYKDD